eukprot:4425040-Pleurochrysis_carterae.AAC.1
MDSGLNKRLLFMNIGCGWRCPAAPVRVLALALCVLAICSHNALEFAFIYRRPLQVAFCDCGNANKRKGQEERLFGITMLCGSLIGRSAVYSLQQYRQEPA